MEILRIINMLLASNDEETTKQDNPSINLNTFNNKNLQGLDKHNNFQKYLFVTLKDTTETEISISKVLVEFYLTDEFEKLIDLKKKKNEDEKDLSVKFEIPLSKFNGVLTPTRHNCGLSAQYFYNTVESLDLEMKVKKIIRRGDIYFDKKNILILSMEFFNILQIKWGVFRLKLVDDMGGYYVSDCFRVHNTIVNTNDQFVKGDLEHLEYLEYNLEYVDNGVLKGFNNMIYSVCSDKRAYIKKKMFYFFVNLIISICCVVCLIIWFMTKDSDSLGA